MIADLHCHSHRSDGELAPAAVVARAVQRGVELLALTDHDTLDGIAEAQAAAAAAGLRFVAGVEISTRWEGHDIHIVGLNVDPQEPALLAGLARQYDARRERGQTIAARLAKAGVPGCWERACALAGNERPGRPHFARAIVEAGAARDIEHAFNRFLKQGQVAYVPTPWATVAEAVGWIRTAGGTAVIAHPARYRLTRSKLRRLVAEFAAAGGGALEVQLPGQQPNQVQAMVLLANQHGLAGSVASDFHGGSTPWAQLGAAGELVAGVRPVWELF
ncbi:MAG: PHP domain-containing protein [Pseudomonadota bacterium]